MPGLARTSRRSLDHANPVEQGDAAVAFSLARFRDHPAVQRAAKVGEVSDQEPLYAITGITFAIGLLSGDRRLAEAGGRMLGAVVLSAVLKSLVKKTVTRTRPNAVMEGGRYRTALHGDERKQRQSFPSGHAAGATAAARALLRLYPQAGWVCMGAASIVGVIRVIQGAHYPLDVVGGAVVGLASEAAVDAGVRAGRVLAPPAS